MARRTKRCAGTRDSRRVAGAVGLLGITAAMGARAASGAFLASTAPETNIDAGTLTMSAADGDTVATIQSFDLALTGMIPNFSFQRIVTTTNGAQVGFSALDLAISDSCVTAPACDDDEITNNTTNGLLVLIKRCSAPWTYNNGTNPYETYVCSAPATATVITADSGLDGGFDPLVGSWNATAAASLTPGGVNYYSFTFKLPDTALDSMQGESARIRVTFNGTSRAGINK